MRTRKAILFGIGIFFGAQHAQAQFFNKIKNHAAGKVNEAVDKVIDHAQSSNDTVSVGDTPQNRARPTINEGAGTFNFTPGGNVLFQDNFSNDSIGAFPKRWKTNASGSVVTVSGVSGNWFLLNNDATYKLDTLLSMPGNFTVEFDILALCDKAEDLSALNFGFVRDNSTTGYISDIGVAGVSLYYMNRDEYYTASRDLDNHHFGNFNLVNTINAPLHVSIQVDGTKMKVFLGQTGILDAAMFQSGTRKYFFISAPLNYKNDAKVLIGNVRIAEQ